MDEAPNRPPHACEAWGCPMAGGISQGSGWYCRFHFGKDAKEFDGITREIRSGETLRQEEASKAKPSPAVLEMWKRMKNPPAMAYPFLDSLPPAGEGGR